MTFGLAFKCKIKNDDIIFSIIDSKSTITIDNEQIIKLDKNSQKLLYQSNSNTSLIKGGTSSNISAIFQSNNFEEFKKKYIELENKCISTNYSIYLISIQKELKLIKLTNINKKIEFKELNSYFFGPNGNKDIISNILTPELTNKLNNKPNFNSYFELFLQAYIITYKANKRYEKYVNNIFQLSITSKYGISILHHPEINVDLKEYSKINFPDLKKISRKIFDNLFLLIKINIELVLTNKKNLKNIKNEGIEDLIELFIKKDSFNFFQLFNKIIEKYKL